MLYEKLSLEYEFDCSYDRLHRIGVFNITEKRLFTGYDTYSPTLTHKISRRQQLSKYAFNSPNQAGKQTSSKPPLKTHSIREAIHEDVIISYGFTFTTSLLLGCNFRVQYASSFILISHSGWWIRRLDECDDEVKCRQFSLFVEMQGVSEGCRWCQRHVDVHWELSAESENGLSTLHCSILLRFSSRRMLRCWVADIELCSREPIDSTWAMLMYQLECWIILSAMRRGCRYRPGLGLFLGPARC